MKIIIIEDSKKLADFILIPLVMKPRLQYRIFLPLM